MEHSTSSLMSIPLCHNARSPFPVSNLRSSQSPPCQLYFLFLQHPPQIQHLSFRRFARPPVPSRLLDGSGCRPTLLMIASRVCGMSAGEEAGTLQIIRFDEDRQMHMGTESTSDTSLFILGAVKQHDVATGASESHCSDGFGDGVISDTEESYLDSNDEESEDELDGFAYDIAALEDDSIYPDADCSGDENADLDSLNYNDVSSFSKTKFQRFKDFLTHAQTQENDSLNINELTSLYDFPIDRFQRLAIEGFLKGSSVVVCAPTSSGKTLIAEAAAAAILASGKRLFYTTPLKALSNQKLREFREMFGEVNVGLLTGDAAVNRDAPILIMTTEILRNMLYQSAGTVKEGAQLFDVQAIVLDEVHYLSDISRGTVWEETVIYCPKNVQLICLSATVSNPEELAGWIAEVHGPTELVTSKRRPVPLTWHFSTRFFLLPLLNEQATAMNRRLSLKRSDEKLPAGKVKDIKRVHSKGNRHIRKGDSWEEPQPLSEEQMQFLRRRQVPQVKDTLMQLQSRDMLPAIWFIFSRKGCDTAVRYVEHIRLLSEDEQTKVRHAVERFRNDFPEAIRESAVSPLLQGFAAHHAGCLPLWKSFIEELFQRGLVKVVFATETLAAGINMPARTTVLSSLSKRGDDGHSVLSANSMLQMAGRAGRRGIDEVGHVVLVQTPFAGAEECCRLLFAGPDPLVSQFTASYGMVLNLLAGMRLTSDEAKPIDGKVLKRGRTLEEARALIEQSFGNYVGSDVMLAAKQKLAQLQEDIEKLQNQCLPTLENRISKTEYDEYLRLKNQVRQERQHLKEFRYKLEQQRMNIMQPLLEESLKEHLPFVCLCYQDPHSGAEQLISAVCVGIAPSHSFSTQQIQMYSLGDLQIGKCEADLGIMKSMARDIGLFMALGSDNVWYIFTGRSVKSIYKIGLPNEPLGVNGIPAQVFLTCKLPDSPASWQNVGKSGSDLLSSVWCTEGSVETLSWSTSVPSLSNLPDDLQMLQVLLEAEMIYMNQRKSVSKLRKKLKSTEANREFLKLSGLQKLCKANIVHLEEKKYRINSKISRMQPSGWKEFLQVAKVLEDAEAIKRETYKLCLLGETATGIRGVNELWLAVAFSHSLFVTLNPAQLAAVCGSFVSEGVKTRTDFDSSGIYKVSRTVEEALVVLEERQKWLLGLQTRHGVEISCDLDDQFAGMVEAWASGVTWKELIMDCAMDEGDVARLLRRSIDLLAQIPFLQHLDPAVRKTARVAATVMDRAPISELIA